MYLSPVKEPLNVVNASTECHAPSSVDNAVLGIKYHIHIKKIKGSTENF